MFLTGYSHSKCNEDTEGSVFAMQHLALYHTAPSPIQSPASQKIRRLQPKSIIDEQEKKIIARS